MRLNRRSLENRVRILICKLCCCDRGVVNADFVDVALEAVRHGLIVLVASVEVLLPEPEIAAAACILRRTRGRQLAVYVEVALVVGAVLHQSKVCPAAGAGRRSGEHTLWSARLPLTGRLIHRP